MIKEVILMNDLITERLNILNKINNNESRRVSFITDSAAFALIL